MRQKCPTCRNERQLVANSPRLIRHALPELRYPLEIVQPFSCPTCGKEVSRNIRIRSTNARVDLPVVPRNQPRAEHRNGRILAIDGKNAMSLNYPAASVPGRNELFPVQEGMLGTGRSIDRHGNPDLMAEFAAEYLTQYRAIVPKGRLPRTMTEMMPALHLLVNAAELALKADLIRSGKTRGVHDLRALYRELEDEHREEAERRFANVPPNARLNAIRADRPTVENVLGVYDQNFGGSTVYMDTRYFAEPTTNLRSESLKGGNIIKTMPYPIFLPFVVQTILDIYAHFSGAERLKRLGADVAQGAFDPGKDQHGDWGLVPGSIGVVVIAVPQRVAWDDQHADRDVFSRFKAARPPGYTTSWMYGGQSLLFYRADRNHPEDGETVIDGLECKVWYAGRLSMHARDLYLLADALTDSTDFSVLQWTG